MDTNTTPTTPAMGPKKDNKVAYLVIGIVVVLIAIAAIWYASVTRQPTSQPPTTQVDNSIKNDSDLTSVEKSLDSSDIDGLGSELDQNDTDASQF